MFEGYVEKSQITSEERSLAVITIGEEAVKLLEDSGFKVGAVSPNEIGWRTVFIDAVSLGNEDGIMRFTAICGGGKDFIDVVTTEYDDLKSDEAAYADEMTDEDSAYNTVVSKIKSVLDKVNLEKLPPSFYVGYDDERVEEVFEERYGSELLELLGDNGIRPMYLWHTTPVEDYTKITLSCFFGEGTKTFILHLPLEDAGKEDRARGASFKKAFAHAITTLETNDFVQYEDWQYPPDEKYFWSSPEYSKTSAESFKIAHGKLTQVMRDMTPLLKEFDNSEKSAELKDKKSDKDSVER